MNDNPLQALGLALKAGKLIHGTERVLKSVKQYPNGIVFLASDAGENLRKKAHDKTTFYKTQLIDTYSQDALSKAIGKEQRTILLLTDKGFYNPATNS